MLCGCPTTGDKGHIWVWNSAQRGWPHFGEMQAAEPRLRGKTCPWQPNRPPEGPRALVFQATGGQPKPTGWRNWGVDRSGSPQQITSSPVPWAAVEAEPAGKVGQGTDAPSPVLARWEKAGAPRRSQATCGDASELQRGASLRLRARGAGARSRGAGVSAVPKWREKERNPGPGQRSRRECPQLPANGGLAIGVPLPRQRRREWGQFCLRVGDHRAPGAQDTSWPRCHPVRGAEHCADFRGRFPLCQ